MPSIECVTVALEAAALQGWLALAGGLAAVVALLVARSDASRAQAAQILAFPCEFHYAPPAGEPGFTVVEVRNGSGLPLFEVGVAAWDWGHRARLWRIRRPSEWMTGARITGRFYSVITMATLKVDRLPPPSRPIRDEDRENGLLPPILLTFRDAHGRRWVRWPDGKLTRRWPSRSS